MLTRSLTAEQLMRVLLYVNIGMYVLSLIIRPDSLGFSFNPFRALSPRNESIALLGATGTWVGDIASHWWTLITASYLHGSIMHILFNLFALYQIGPLVIQLYGPYRFAIIYTLSGAAGFLLSYLMGNYLTLGASAALCGLIGAAVFYGKDRGGTFGQAIYRQIGGWGLGILLFGFVVPRIDNWAHIGGMVAGALLAFTFGYQEKRRIGPADRLLYAACLLVTALCLLWSVYRGLMVMLFAR